jgi:hypothetical protein
MVPFLANKLISKGGVKSSLMFGLMYSLHTPC